MRLCGSPGCRHVHFANARRVSRRLSPKPNAAVAAVSPDDLVHLGLSTNDASRVLAAVPKLADPANHDCVVSNLAFLRTVYKPSSVAKLLCRQPELFTARLAEWHQFLTGYGLSNEAVWKVLRYTPELLLRAGGDSGTANTPYNAGSAIVFLKSYGWTDDDIVLRVLPCYSEVLAATPEQLQAAVDFLRSRGFDEESVRRMVLTFPQLLVASYGASLFQLIDRIRASAHNKYVVSGSYHV